MIEYVLAIVVVILVILLLKWSSSEHSEHYKSYKKSSLGNDSYNWGQSNKPTGEDRRRAADNVAAINAAKKAHVARISCHAAIRRQRGTYDQARELCR